MRKRTVMGILFILAGCYLFGCAPIPYAQTGWDYWPPDKIYTVTGRVLTFENLPVTNVKVVLQRQKSDKKGFPSQAPLGSDGNEIAKPSSYDSDLTVVAEHLVANTDRLGEFSFQFEPWGAYDVWLYFDALDQGFAPQRLQLNSLIRGQVMRGSGRNPLRINIILEPMQDGPSAVNNSAQ
jgi:hypothetical protein